MKPASIFFSLQMKVRDSTRATSDSSELAKYELGYSFSLSFFRMPFWVSCVNICCCCCFVPETQHMFFGWVSWVICSTQVKSFLCVVGWFVKVFVLLASLLITFLSMKVFPVLYIFFCKKLRFLLVT